MDRQAMLDRTRALAVRIVRMVAAIPSGRIGDVLGRQVLKSGTSVGTNYREATRSSSRRRFISNLEIVQRELHETSYWLDLLAESGVVKPSRLDPLLKEVNELLAIVTASVRTAKRHAAPPADQKSEIRDQR